MLIEMKFTQKTNLGTERQQHMLNINKHTGHLRQSKHTCAVSVEKVSYLFAIMNSDTLTCDVDLNVKWQLVPALSHTSPPSGLRWVSCGCLGDKRDRWLLQPLPAYLWFSEMTHCHEQEKTTTCSNGHIRGPVSGIGSATALTYS